ADTIGCRAVWDARSMSQDLARRPHPPPAWLGRDYHAGEVSAYPRSRIAPLVPTCGRVPTARRTVSFLGPVGRSWARPSEYRGRWANRRPLPVQRREPAHAAPGRSRAAATGAAARPE